MECEDAYSRLARYYSSVECIWHLQAKAIEHHQRKQEERARLTESWGRRRRNSDSSWERKSREWLSGFPEDEDAVMEDEGDAFYNLQEALGNDSGPSEGPAQL